ncbi:hypothetical protein ACFLRR_02125 [Bacteroidota bacterium]
MGNLSLYKKIIIFFISIVFIQTPTHPNPHPDLYSFCRYTVREIGFSNIDAQAYQLMVLINNTVSQDVISNFQRIPYALFLESNIEVNIVDINENNDSLISYAYNKLHDKSLPAVFLTGIDKSIVNIPFNKTKEEIKEEIWALSEQIADSEIRNILLNKITNSFAVIMFFESEDEPKNKVLANEIQIAQNEFREISGLLAKPMKEAPVIIKVPFENRNSEKILMWSMGIENLEKNESAVTILYGRGRIIGPVLTKKMINHKSIFNLLSVIGADCECGLDQSWILGKMLPLVWSTESRDAATKLLGFDVDNPMIMSEMSQILSVSFRNKELEEILPDLVDNNILDLNREKVKQSDKQKNDGLLDLVEGKPFTETVVFIVSFIFGFGIVIYVMYLIRKRRK